MPLDSGRNETCDALKDRFTYNYAKFVEFNKVYQSLAAHLAEKCWEVVDCDNAGNLTSNVYKSASTQRVETISEDMCTLLDLLKGPVGECFAYLRDEYDYVQITECAAEQEKVESLKSAPTEDFGTAFKNSLFTVTTCTSLFHNCTQSLIKSDCGEEVVEIFAKNKDFLQKINCTGLELFSVEELKFKQTLLDMEQQMAVNNGGKKTEVKYEVNLKTDKKSDV